MKYIIKTIAVATLILTVTSCTVAAEKYPLDTCIVSDNHLGSMGDPVSIEYQGREIKLCCKPCIKKFNKAPQKYMKKLNNT